MFKRVSYRVAIGLSATVLLLSACGANQEPMDDKSVHAEVKDHEIDVIEPHKGLNQEPVPLNIERDGKDVYVEMTTQVTDIEIEPGYMYKAWTFNGEAPGPLIVV